MALQKCELNLNHTKKELQPHGTFSFPCAGYSHELTDKGGNSIPWHWHDEIEIVYVKSGVLKIQIPAKTIILKSKECMIINSGILHYAIANPVCELNSLVFDSTLITGNHDSAIAQKYVLPLLSYSSFDGYLLKSDKANELISGFNNAFHALADSVFGFEFIVREHLSKIFLFLYQEYEQQLMAENTMLNQDNIRIRKMLDFIHDNFSDNITLTEIARAADIGERECLRCFQRTIQLSPMQYLLKYRIMQGAEYLMKNPLSSIAEIAALSGFDSPSNFSKMFKRFYNCTPREYRKTNRSA